MILRVCGFQVGLQSPKRLRIDLGQSLLSRGKLVSVRKGSQGGKHKQQQNNFHGYVYSAYCTAFANGFQWSEKLPRDGTANERV
jgi:hypothetical protein